MAIFAGWPASIIAVVSLLPLWACQPGSNRAADETSRPTPGRAATGRSASPHETHTFLVASPDGLLRAGTDGSTEELRDTPTAAAYSVGDRIVYQELSESRASRLAGAILVGPGEPGEQPEADTSLIGPGPETVALRLHGTATIDGRPVAIITERTGDQPEEQVQLLATLDLETGERQRVAETGGWESGADSVSYTADGFVILGSGDPFATSRYTEYLSSDGEPLEEPHDPLPEPCDREGAGGDPPCPTDLVGDPDGRWLAWIVGSEVVVVDRNTGDVEVRKKLPEGSGRAELELTTERLVVNRWNASARPHIEPVPPLVIRLSRDEETPEEPTELSSPGYGTALTGSEQ